MVILSELRRKARRAALGVAMLAGLAACDVPLVPQQPGSAPRTGGDAVQIALLIPSSDAGAAPVARSLENAARLAIADFAQQPMDIRVYDTGGRADLAAAQAQQAVDDGAQIILGPLFGAAANAAGVAVADEGVSVLSFSNTTDIAGGNVFILGQTFANTAERLTQYAASRGRSAMVVVHPDDTTGQIARLAVERAAAQAGLRVIAAEAYPLSLEGVSATARRAQASAQAGADTVFLTTDATNAAMPMLLQLLPENGLPPGQVQYLGLTRWDVRPDLFNLPGAEGSWFAVPDRARIANFEARYRQNFAAAPHPLASIAYDGVAAIASVAASGPGTRLDASSLTRGSGFQGAGGPFRLLPNGTNRRSLAVATIQNSQVTILDPAPLGVGAPAF